MSRAQEKRDEDSRTYAALLGSGRAQEDQDSFQGLAAKKVTLAAAREAMFLERLAEILEKTFKGKFAPPKGLTKKSGGRVKRIENVALSDIHYGSALKLEEVGHEYGWKQEARRTAKVAQSVVEYKSRYRDDSKLFVHLLGDVIQGQLHDPRDGDPLAMQFASSVNSLIQAVAYMAAAYPNGVVVRCQPGNHGRNTARHHDRAVHQKWDAIETMIYVALRQALARYPNISFEIPKTPFYTWQAFNRRGFATHGDTVLEVGYPSETISISKIKSKVDEINSAAGKEGQEYSLFVVGHVHFGVMAGLPGGEFLITNPPLIPSDHYAISKGRLRTKCGQWMWESVPDHILGDARYIEISDEDDNNAQFDSIIKPFDGGL